MARFSYLLLPLLGLNELVSVESFTLVHSRAMGGLRAATSAGRTNVVVADSALDEGELTKLFGRLADKTLLLDVEGAGTPEMKGRPTVSVLVNVLPLYFFRCDVATRRHARHAMPRHAIATPWHNQH